MNTGYLDTILEFLLTNIEHEAVSTDTSNLFK